MSILRLCEPITRLLPLFLFFLGTARPRLNTTKYSSSKKDRQREHPLLYLYLDFLSLSRRPLTLYILVIFSFFRYGTSKAEYDEV